MNSFLHSLLLSEVPGWDDDVVSAARFKALTGQRTDWEGRHLFWKDLIIKTARHLNLIVIDMDQVLHTWFLRGGLTPLCLTGVLMEMYRCGDLQKLGKQQERTRFSWFWSQVRNGVFGSASDSSESISGRFIVTSLLHERLTEVTKSICENAWTSSCVTTVAHFNKICGSEEEAKILQNELVKSKRGIVFTTDGNIAVEGLKVTATQAPVSNVTKLDCYMVTIYSTVGKLETQMNTLERAYVRSKQCAIEALQRKDKVTAKKYVQSMRVLARNKAKCTGFQERLQELLSSISQAEMIKEVSQAMKVGRDALKEYIIPLEDIQASLDEIEEATLLNKEIANTLGSSVDGLDDMELELELAELEQEDATVVPMVGVNDAVSNQHVGQQTDNAEVSNASLEEVADALKGLSLKPEAA